MSDGDELSVIGSGNAGQHASGRCRSLLPVASRAVNDQAAFTDRDEAVRNRDGSGEQAAFRTGHHRRRLVKRLGAGEGWSGRTRNQEQHKRQVSSGE